MKKDGMTVRDDQLTELKERISETAMFTETMWKQYSRLSEDNRYTDRAEDSRIRADVYCECTLLLKALVQSD